MPDVLVRSRASSRVMEFLLCDPTGDEVGQSLVSEFLENFHPEKLSITMVNTADSSIVCLGDFGFSPSQTHQKVSNGDADWYPGRIQDIQYKNDYFGWNSDRTLFAARMKIRFKVVGTITIQMKEPLSNASIIELESLISEIIDPLTLFLFSRRSYQATEWQESYDGIVQGLKTLTERQLKILTRIATGQTNSKIAGELGYSVSTIRHETMRIYEYLAVSDRREAAVKAVSMGLVA